MLTRPPESPHPIEGGERLSPYVSPEWEETLLLLRAANDLQEYQTKRVDMNRLNKFVERSSEIPLTLAWPLVGLDFEENPVRFAQVLKGEMHAYLSLGIHGPQGRESQLETIYGSMAKAIDYYDAISDQQHEEAREFRDAFRTNGGSVQSTRRLLADGLQWLGLHEGNVEYLAAATELNEGIYARSDRPIKPYHLHAKFARFGMAHALIGNEPKLVEFLGMPSDPRELQALYYEEMSHTAGYLEKLYEDNFPFEIKDDNPRASLNSQEARGMFSLSERRELLRLFGNLASAAGTINEVEVRGLIQDLILQSADPDFEGIEQGTIFQEGIRSVLGRPMASENFGYDLVLTSRSAGKIPIEVKKSHYQKQSHISPLTLQIMSNGHSSAQDFFRSVKEHAATMVRFYREGEDSLAAKDRARVQGKRQKICSKRKNELGLLGELQAHRDLMRAVRERAGLEIAA